MSMPEQVRYASPADRGEADRIGGALLRHQQGHLTEDAAGAKCSQARVCIQADAQDPDFDLPLFDDVHRGPCVAMGKEGARCELELDLPRFHGHI